MISKSHLSITTIAVLAAGLFVMGISTTAYAEITVPLHGIYHGYDTEGDDFSGSFVDWGTYSIFNGVVETHGTYEFVEDATHDADGYYTTTYTISDENGNLLEFTGIEISWTEYAKGKFGVAQNEWKIVNGEGKFEGATGEGSERVWFNLEDMSYVRTTSGTIFLS